ncbi:MAG: hypothetical protein KJZ80_20260, partial [Hyphomicrobiaceae bacterium]|nr:hypothetical protein [Hyphomicrobiaceae bacterium]
VREAKSAPDGGFFSGLLGFRCSTSGEVAVVYLTRERWNDSLDALPYDLLLKFDNGPTVRLRANGVEVDDRLGLYANDYKGGREVLKVFDGISATKKRIDVAIELMGNIFEPQRFGSVGSRKAIEKLVRDCDLEMPEKLENSPLWNRPQQQRKFIGILAEARTRLGGRAK